MPYPFGIEMIFIRTQILDKFYSRLRKQFKLYPPPFYIHLSFNEIIIYFLICYYNLTHLK